MCDTNESRRDGQYRAQAESGQQPPEEAQHQDAREGQAMPRPQGAGTPSRQRLCNSPVV